MDLPRRFAAAIGPANAESITAVEIPCTFQVMLLWQGPSGMRLPLPNLKALWSFHADYQHCYDKPTIQIDQHRSNLLETQTGR